MRAGSQMICVAGYKHRKQIVPRIQSSDKEVFIPWKSHTPVYAVLRQAGGKKLAPILHGN